VEQLAPFRPHVNVSQACGGAPKKLVDGSLITAVPVGRSMERTTMPTIEVFLMFPPTARNSHNKTVGKTVVTTVEPGPNWERISGDLRSKGYTLIVHGPSFQPSVQNIQDSMQNAEVTLFVGHGVGTTVGSKFISTKIALKDGMIKSPDGMFTGTWNADTLENRTPVGKLKINRVTGIFTCNSTDKLPDAFYLPPGNHLITNDGGPDGDTRIGTLELGAAEFVTWYARTEGNVRTAMSKAQFQFTLKGGGFASDKGDTLSDTVGPMCEVKDW
jgi:hypothetical protein